MAQSFEIVQTKNCAHEDIYYYVFVEPLSADFLEVIETMGEIIHPMSGFQAFFKIDCLEYQITGNIGRRDLCFRVRHSAREDCSEVFERLLEQYCKKSI